MEDLLRLVKDILLPAVSPMKLRIVEHSESESFGDAFVVLRADGLRVRVLRDRGIIFADFGSAAAPQTWFDSAVVLEYLGLSAKGGFHSEDARTGLAGLAGFLRTLHGELTKLFDKHGFRQREQELSAVRKRQAESTWKIRLP